jgi:hypothetical protein
MNALVGCERRRLKKLQGGLMPRKTTLGWTAFAQMAMERTSRSLDGDELLQAFTSLQGSQASKIRNGRVEA